MFTILLVFILGLIACYFIAKAILKFIPKKAHPIVSLVLYALIVLLAYLTYNAVMAPIKFHAEKKVRYTKVIKNLKIIRDAQAAHKKVTGQYAKDGDALVKFMDTAVFADVITMNLVRKVDKGGGIEIEEEYRKIDTVGYTDVRASFAGRDYANMMTVPGTSEKFKISLGNVQKAHGYMAPVFLVEASKEAVLNGMDADLIRQEKEAITNDQVKGANISVGSLAEATDSGNWPPMYDQGDVKK
ncbi:MAG: hypothetical protein ACI8RP_000275 [Urechidicola sp.]|jgi:hypothetical protein|tara:strand:- start:225 stop:953 length:729 start_codon:yes stop_codon:yes gene_type:complete